MKAEREHRVPFVPRRLVILRQVKPLANDAAYIFPDRTVAKPMSNMVFLMTLRRGEVPMTVHCFRSAFRDRAAETTNIPREVAEMALSHIVENRVEVAYCRGGLLAKRRELMKSWSEYVAGAKQ